MTIKAAKQERSRRTFTSLLDATEELLMERTFDEIKVQEIVSLAGASIGSFYARFSDKETLRECLIDRYHDDMIEVATRRLAPEEWEGKPMAPRAEAFVAGVAETCRRRWGLMRMRFLHTIAHGGLSDEHLAKTRKFVSLVEAFLLPCLNEIKHPDPREALAFSLRMIDTMIASTILFDRGEGTSYRDINDDILIKETTRAFLAYLGVRENNND
jgi:AcrR family transcriptional regulator